MRYTTVSAIGAGTAYPFGEHMFISVRVVQSLVLCEVFCEPLFVLFQSNRSGNQERTIQRNWQHWAHKTQNEDKQNTKTQRNTEN
jgi:hypothetical protein